MKQNIKIAILDSKVAGFGTSGRNGGWCSALFPVELDKLAEQSNKEKAVRMQNIMFETVDEVGNVIRTENIDHLYQSLLDNKTSLHPNGHLQTKPWGQKEFALLDPDNNLLTFGQNSKTK